MNSNTKIAVSIIVLIVIVVAGYYIITMPPKSQVTSLNATSSNAEIVQAFVGLGAQENATVATDEGAVGVSAMTQAVNDTANAYDTNSL